MRHWISSNFVLLGLSSLYLYKYHIKNGRKLSKEERVLLWGFAAYFGVFVITALVNGWEYQQTKHLGIEIRYLFFIPIYLVVRNLPQSKRYLFMGSMLAVFVAGVDVLMYLSIDGGGVYHADGYRYMGAYSPLLVGPVILLFAVICISDLESNQRTRGSIFLIIAMLCITLLITEESSARIAILASLILFSFLIYFVFDGLLRVVVFVVLSLLISFSVVFVEPISKRVDIVKDEISQYSKMENSGAVNEPLGSVQLRLEMWRATKYFFNDSAIFGVGLGNYSEAVKKYIDKKLVHPGIGMHSHPHNVYSEMLISRGIFGVIVFLWITILPLSYFISSYAQGNRHAFTGILFILSFLIFSLTEASTFTKGNFSSLYIVFLAVLFSDILTTNIDKQE
ncbi:MAG: O-antigen ligase family protein [Gammaproteobacteria bacterium]|nr:O-antigen ligase family protein [Gammaproteobacteria bacterium]